MTTFSFSVKEAEKRDAGKNYVRLHPEDMKELEVKAGEILQITGEKVTAAKALPALLGSRELGVIQIDGITRENVGADLGEKVKVEKIECLGAQEMTLEPIGRTSLSQKDIRQALESMVVSQGDRVRITLLGGQYQEFIVTKLISENLLKPEAPSLVNPETKVLLTSKGKPVDNKRKKDGITYEDIGGLKNELQRIREMIELPLKHPELFERVGIEPPKGVLLVGPPGCGKTLIARAIANEVNANFYKISGPEVFGKFVGQSAAQVRKVFETASTNLPSIIFIDELDAMAGKRSEMTAEKTEHLAVVDQLCDLMDGLKERGQIIVIGATNLPDTLDPALRRSGRFDREIEIGVPDRDGRLEILEIHTRAMPLTEDVNLKGLAARTHGFVGADISALAREAAMNALRGVLPDINLADAFIPSDKLQNLYVGAKNFEDALKEVRPSALREVFLERTDVTWQDIGGLEEIKEALKEAVEWPLKHQELFKQMATKSPVGILLSGPSGCGKTLVGKALANETEVNFISIKGPALMSKWVGETEKQIREVFHKARQHAPCIIFFDEVEAIAPKRGKDVTGVSDRALSQLLTEVDGMEPLNGVVILAATNRLDLVDEAFLRPGRFDFHFQLPLPNEKSRQEIFKIHTQKKPLAEDVDLAILAQRTEGCSGADIANICMRASLLAIREFLESGSETIAVIKEQHFLTALEAVN